MYLQFLDLYGNPVYLRPERVDALRGVAVTWDDKPRAATLILMTNRETFRVRGLVDVVHDAIVAWHKDREPLPVNPTLTVSYGEMERITARDANCPFLACRSPSSCEKQGRCIDDQGPADTDNTL